VTDKVTFQGRSHYLPFYFYVQRSFSRTINSFLQKISFDDTDYRKFLVIFVMSGILIIKGAGFSRDYFKAVSCTLETFTVMKYHKKIKFLHLIFQRLFESLKYRYYNKTRMWSVIVLSILQTLAMAIFRKPPLIFCCSHVYSAGRKAFQSVQLSVFYFL